MKTSLTTLFCIMTFVTSLQAQSLYRSNTGTGQTIRSIVLMDDSNGVAVGDSGILVATTNGGGMWHNFAASWQSPPSSFLGSLNVAFFNDTLNGSVAGDAGTIFTNIKGKKAIKNILPGANAVSGMTFPSYDTGVICGAQGLFAMTTDSGRTWNIIALPKAAQSIDFHGTDYFDDDTYWLVGQRGIVLYTEDDGAHWQVISVPTTNDLYSIYFPDDGSATGWIVGDRTLLTTTDGGDDWTSQSITDSLRWVEGWDSTDAYATGLHGAIDSTSNRANWYSVSSGTRANLYGFDYTDDWLYYCGDSGIILTSLPPMQNAQPNFVLEGDDTVPGSELSFGNILDGTNSVDNATLINTSNVLVTITNISSDSSEFTINDTASNTITPFALDSGDARLIEVTFTPTATSTIHVFQSMLRVTSVEAGERDIPMTATGVPTQGSVANTPAQSINILLTSGSRSNYLSCTGNWTSDIRLEVFNVLGTSVYSSEAVTMPTQIGLPGSLPSGIYFYRFSNANNEQTGKFSLQ